jgi:hypothetical protein
VKRFFIKPSAKSHLRVEVRIYDTKKAMLRGITRSGCYAGAFEAQGVKQKSPGALTEMFRKFKIDGKRHSLLPHFATIFLHRKQCGGETVYHELGHVALAWARRVGWRITRRTREGMQQDERFCYVLSDMACQFGDRVWWAKRRRA